MLSTGFFSKEKRGHHFTIQKHTVLRVLIWQNLNCLTLQFFLLTKIPSMYPFYWIFMPESIHGEKPVNVCFLKTSHLPVVFTFLCPANSVVYFLRFRFRFLLLKSYGSGSDFEKVMVLVPTFEKKLRFRFRFRFQVHI